MLPAGRYLLERSVGLKGTKTYGIGMGVYAAHTLATYPFDVAEKHPGKSLPWLSPDPRNGHWVFRPAWKDGNDILMTLNLQSHVLGGCHYERTGIMSGWRLVGFGQTWMHGQYHPAVDGLEKAVAFKNGPQTVAWKADGRVATMSLDATPAYMAPIQKSRGEKRSWESLARQQGARQAHFLPHWGGGLLDVGIRAKRWMAVDCSGVSGAPLLVAVAEQVERTPSADADAAPTAITWSLPLKVEAGELATSGRQFTVSKGGAKMKGIVLGGGDLDAKSGAAKSATGKVLAVFVLSRKDVSVTATGDGVGATIKVGERTVRFDGKAIRLD